MDLDGVPSEVADALAALNGSLDLVEQQLDPLFRVDGGELERNCAHLENARLQASLAYALNSLFFVYLRTKGVDVSRHPVQEEIERVKGYITKVRAISSSVAESESAAKKAAVEVADAASSAALSALKKRRASDMGGASASSATSSSSNGADSGKKSAVALAMARASGAVANDPAGDDEVEDVEMDPLEAEAINARALAEHDERRKAKKEAKKDVKKENKKQRV